MKIFSHYCRPTPAEIRTPDLANTKQFNSDVLLLEVSVCITDDMCSRGKTWKQYVSISWHLPPPFHESIRRHLHVLKQIACLKSAYFFPTLWALCIWWLGVVFVSSQPSMAWGVCSRLAQCNSFLEQPTALHYLSR